MIFNGCLEPEGIFWQILQDVSSESSDLLFSVKNFDLFMLWIIEAAATATQHALRQLPTAVPQQIPKSILNK